MNYNGIHGKRFILEQDDCLIELRYDISGDLSKTGIYISKDNGQSWKKVPDLDDLSKEVANAIATIQSGLSTPINIALESQLPDLTGTTDWVASTSYSVGDLVLYNNTVYKCITANSDAQFTDTNWDVVCKDGTYYSIQEMDVTAPGRAGRAWYNSAEDKDSWQIQFDHQGRPITEYDNYSNNDVITQDSVVTVDKVLYRAKTDVTCHANWNTDKKDFEELKTSGAILNEFVPNHYYAENEMIVEDGYIYTRKTAGISLGTLGDDIANWKTQTKLHQDGQRYVSFTLGSLPSTTDDWETISNYVFVDGDATMLGLNYVVAPVDGLYYLNFNSISLGSTTTNNITLLKATKTFQIDNQQLCSSITNGDLKEIPTLTGIFHLKAGEKVYNHMYTTNALEAVNTIPSEFGLIAEDQSTNVVVEADLVKPSSISSGANFYAVQNISNPTILRTDGTLVIPEDGIYLLNCDTIVASDGGSVGIADIIVAKNDSNLSNENQLYHKALYNSFNTISAGFTTLIEAVKGDEINIKMQKDQNHTRLTYGSNMKPKIRLIKVKSTEVKLTAKDLYNQYIDELPSNTKPQSYDSFIKALVQRQAMHMEVKLRPTNCIRGNNILSTLTHISGENMLVDGTKFTAPVSGLYQLHGIFHSNEGTSTYFRIGILKNSITPSDNTWVAVMDTSGDSEPKYKQSIDTIVWLNANDYLSIDLNTGDALTEVESVGNIEFSLIPCGSDLINYPNMWDVNTEYDFGNGLYGKRFKFTSLTNQEILFLNENDSKYNMIDWGGSLIYTNGNKWTLPCSSVKSDMQFGAELYQDKDNKKWRFQVTPQTITITNLDLWVKYTKN